MINQNDNHNDPCFQDLFSGIASGHYPHLKIFMSRNNDDHRLPQNFLYVDPCSFGKVRVSDLWYRDDKIFLEVKESCTGTINIISVDVNARPEFLMVKWDDVVSMVQNESTSSTIDDTVLDFEF